MDTFSFISVYTYLIATVYSLSQLTSNVNMTPPKPESQCLGPSSIQSRRSWELSKVIANVFRGAVSETYISPKIVGGTNAVEGDYPWFVVLKEDGEYVCGGSIIDKRNILTAAHCVSTYSVMKKKLRIVAGEYNSKVVAGNEQEVKVVSAVTHHQFNSRILANDIAILHLKTSLKFTDNVKPVKLSYKNFDGKAVNNNTLKCFALGFGAKKSTRSYTPRYLQVANRTFVSNQKCQTALDDLDLSETIKTTHICTIDDSSFTCQGDSGGPVACHENNGVYRQVGTVSWGASNDCTFPPSINTRVSKYKRWIRDNLIGQKASNNCSSST